MTKLTRVLALLAAALSFSAAADETNIFWGGDDASCARWMKYKNNQAVRQYYLYWIQGFASGHNLANPSRQVKVGALPAAEDIYRYLDQYCQDNPKSSFIGGAIELIRELREPAPKPPAAKSGAKPVPAK
jgi:hypothetical protein